MNKEERRNPEELLKAIKWEQSQGGKGRLKIFFGMSAGVGKTYAMLEEAHQIYRTGIDVVVGIVDTHGREETARLLHGLKVIPEKLIFYKDKEFKELDLDAVINLHPQLVLVDELAHSNIPGLRHAKRWQDIIEILDNGIDVYTTLNVQHIESLNDIVKGITEVSVGETVPDLLVERAAAIQFVDLTPDELLQRLSEGKVYLGEQSQIARQHFFQKDRLAALREIALRYAAEKVDHDLRSSVPTSKDELKWKPREKFLVAIDHCPPSQKLIRITRRLAASVDAPWLAVHVNTGKTLSEKESNQLAQNLQLARNLGAEVITINDPDIADGIQRVARQKGTTQITLGRAPKKFSFNPFRKQTLLERLSTECTDIALHVIGHERLSAKYRKKHFSFNIKEQYASYIFVFLFVCLLTTINWLLLPLVGYKVIGVIFLIGILTLSLFCKKGPVFFASVLYALTWDFFFIPPTGQFVISSSEDTALLLLYVLTAIATGILADRAREHKKMLMNSEDSARALYDIVEQIAISPSTLELFKSVKEKLKKRFNGDFEILVKEIDDGLVLNRPMPLLTDVNEKNAALWSFGKGEEAGWSTDTLPSSKNLYIPLRGFHEIIGLLIFRPKENKPLTFDEKNFIYTICRQLANHLERTFSEERHQQHAKLRQTEKIYKTILARLSQEFEIPQKIAKQAITRWKNNHLLTEQPEELEVVHEVERSYDAFQKILANIFIMAQLNEGIIPNKTVQNVKKLIKACCQSIKTSQNSHNIKITIQENLPPVFFDFHLMHTLLYNLIMNAIEYSPPSSKIDIEAKMTDKYLILSVTDEGKGIPENQLSLIFEQFYRLPDAASPGIGLGLAIAKTIAELHHGYLKAENLIKGSKFSLFLPI